MPLGASLVTQPSEGRVFSMERRLRLSDMDTTGRLRLDAVARYLQDVAIDDVDETGWGAPDHLWVVRWYRIDVVVPFRADRRVRLSTWCSAAAAHAAGRRTSLVGDGGGRIEVDSAWVHLDADARPARLEDFGVYTASTGGRRASTRLSLPDPPSAAHRTRWQLRSTDADVMGHLNNAVYWAAVEDRLADLEVDVARPHRAVLEYRRPIDVGDGVDLLDHTGDGGTQVAFSVGGDIRAVARITAGVDG